jgi:hypothetical protein
MLFLRKYNVTLDLATAGSERIRIPIRKAGSADFATGSDWTPVAGDVKVGKDGAATAFIGTLPTYSNGSWEFTLSAAELSAKIVEVRIVDAATKAVDDEGFNVETFGNASAMWVTDYTDERRLGMKAIPNADAGTTGGLWPFVATAGTSQANPAPNTFALKLAAAASATNDRYLHCPIFIGNKWRKITSYVGADREAELDDSSGLAPAATTYPYTILDAPSLEPESLGGEVDANVIKWAGTATAIDVNSGLPNVNADAIAGGTQSADRLASMANAYAGGQLDDKGAGADQCTLTITNTTTGQPIADADVWVTSDPAGTSTVAGTLQTDSQGNVLFLLDAGDTYYLWMQKDGENPIRGQSFVAEAD